MIIEFLLLVSSCAASIAPNTMGALVSAESDFNPYAIGVVKGQLSRQPTNLGEAIHTVKRLEKRGFNYSVGLAQINRINFKHYGLTEETMFDPCDNLSAGASILTKCYESAPTLNNADALRDALACYYSGQHKSTNYEKYVNRVISRSKINLKKVSIQTAGIASKSSQPIKISKQHSGNSNKSKTFLNPMPMVSHSINNQDKQPTIVELGGIKGNNRTN